MSRIANTPEPPYYAVIFASERTDGDNGYGQMGEEMVKLVSEQPGFLGAESIRDKDGFGITVSYWESLEAIKNWKENSLHKVAQEKGKAEWYKRYKIRISKIERETSFENI